LAKKLVINEEKCTACRRCELACSMKNAGEFNPLASRITAAVFLDENFYLPVVCQQCDTPYCLEICPAGALQRNETTGAVVLDEKRCIGCRMCIMVCPFGGVDYSVAEQKVVKCDLCGGEPECVKACVWDAIEYKEVSELGLEKRKKVARKLQQMMREVG
jgi:carbon-monoxide dehydrogenase iron sulfur subunit